MRVQRTTRRTPHRVVLLLVLVGICTASWFCEAGQAAASLRMSGRLTITAESWLGSRVEDRTVAVTSAGVSQDLDLSLAVAAPLGPRSAVQLTCDLTGKGYWGVNYPSDGSYGYPPTSLLPTVDQLYAAYATDTLSIAAGRFRPALDPGGLVMSDAYPLEGIMADADLAAFGGSTTATLLWCRLSSEYAIGGPGLVTSDELVAVRAEGRLKGATVGTTLVLSELAGSKAAEVDVSGTLFGVPLTVELAAYRPSPTFVDVVEDSSAEVEAGSGTNGRVGVSSGSSATGGVPRSPGVSYALLASSTFDLRTSPATPATIEVTVGFASPGFTPVFTRIGGSDLVPEVPFTAGSCGAAVQGKVELGRGWALEGGLSLAATASAAGGPNGIGDRGRGAAAARIVFRRHLEQGGEGTVTESRPSTEFAFGMEFGPVASHVSDESGRPDGGPGDPVLAGRLFASWSVEL